MDLKTYNKKRDFGKTKEPKGKRARGSGNRFVVQEHWASHHHFDFRLEIDGVLKSWAVPKGPSLNPKDKRLAVQVEDHPLEYGDFEGVIPEGEYGAGKVIIWDHGSYNSKQEPSKAYREGKLEFELKGKKLHGRWALVKTKIGKSDSNRNWLLIKKADEESQREGEVVKSLPGSVREHRPLSIRPQLASLKEQPPTDPGFLHEIKFDGYRALARLEAGDASIFSRNEKNWTRKFPLIAKAMMSEKIKQAVLDGEIVWLNPKGVSEFGGLQKALKDGRHDGLFYYVFDILELDGADLRDLPLTERREEAKKIVKKLNDKRVRFSESFTAPAKDIYESFCKAGLEGMISKRKNSPYKSGRSDSWVKSKCLRSDEFAIVGFTKRKDTPDQVGALVLAAKKGSKLVEVGRVGTGFDRKERKDLFHALEKHKRKTPPAQTDLQTEDITWVTPKLVAQVKYTEITEAEKLRHPVYQGLREDKPPGQTSLPFQAHQHMSEEEIKEFLTSPEKKLFPGPAITKRELALYYSEAFEWMAPHIKDKILTLLKCPSGVGKGCFYSKHTGNMKGLLQVKVERKGKEEHYFAIDGLEGLMRLVRYNAVEIHTWNARRTSPQVPDEMIFDLDPGAGVRSEQVIESAFELREMLEALGLKCYPKATGGKGLHLHVPLSPTQTTEQVRVYSKSVAYLLEQERPHIYTSSSRLKERKGKIFLDTGRNSLGATYICPYSTRANPNATIAIPLSWEDLGSYDLKDPVTLRSFKNRTKPSYKNPWRTYWDSPCSLEIFKTQEGPLRDIFRQ